MVPVAVAVVMRPETGVLSVTINPSASSTIESDSTLMVTTLLVSFARKVTVPLGRTLPWKSLATAGFDALPVTA